MNVSANSIPGDLAEAADLTTIRDLAAQTREWQSAAGDSLSEVAAGWVAPQYLLALRRELAALPPGPERFKLLRLAVGDTAVLQRWGHSGARLQIERGWLELHQQKHRDALAAAEAEIPKFRDPKLPLSDEDRQAIIDKADEILGLK